MGSFTVNPQVPRIRSMPPQQGPADAPTDPDDARDSLPHTAPLGVTSSLQVGSELLRALADMLRAVRELLRALVRQVSSTLTFKGRWR